MKIVIAGGTGYLGEAISRRLLPRGELVVLSRSPQSVSVGRGAHWSPPDEGSWEAEVETADVVINLAGANIAGRRWNERWKQLLERSRVDSTMAIARVLRRRSTAPRPLFINASGIGFYGDRGDEILVESSASGEGFMPELARKWQAAALDAAENARVVVLRFGVVYGPGDGPIRKMALPFRFFAGGTLGDGRQWASWIALEDLLRLFEWVIENPAAEGIYNAASPTPVTNRELTRELAAVLHRPAYFRIPAFVLRTVFGREMADALFLSSQRVVPQRLLDSGFEFRYPTLPETLEEAFRDRKPPE
jgi:uncharacterized protein